MDNNIKKRRELIKAVLCSIEGSEISQDLRSQIQELKNDKELLEYYVDFMIQHSGLVQAGIGDRIQLPNDKRLNYSMINSVVTTQLLLDERSAPAFSSEPESSDDIDIVERMSPLQMVKRYYPLVGMFAMLASCLVFIAFWLDRYDNSVVVAQVVDEYNVQWADNSRKLAVNAFLYDDRLSYAMSEGSIKILFEDGAKVVVSAPAVFSFKDRDRMQIDNGKLFAHVPKAATGFRVDTPSCGVVDLGTEFGINVDMAGKTDVHLCKGKAMLVPVSNTDSEIITENEARCVRSDGRIDRIDFSGTSFLREFDSKTNSKWDGQNVNLADIVAGGDGFGKAAENVGIDHRNGDRVTGNTENKTNDHIKNYVLVEESPYIDGIFVPDGGNGAVQLTSTGLNYDGFYNTTGDYYMPIGIYREVMTSCGGGEYMAKSLCLKGYEESENLCLHANSGITFDLGVIRKSLKFAGIKSFSSVYGVPVTFTELGNVLVDFTIFIDGKPVFTKKDISSLEDPQKIEIPIGKDDRFLTLTCTEGERNLGDWSVFVDPVLNLEQIE